MKIPVAHGHLEAVLKDPSGPLRGGSVLCHPHPLHGGTMHTKAVYRAGQAMNELGLRTLRFNFRGVGCSTGTFDDGIGEMDDARAALEWLRLGLREGPVVLGGVSFGSMVGLSVGAEDPEVGALLALAVPIHVYDYSFLARTEKPVLVVQGEQDPFGSPSQVEDILGDLGDHIVIRGIKGAGHLFDGHFDELRSLIREFFTSGRGGTVLEPCTSRAREVTP